MKLYFIYTQWGSDYIFFLWYNFGSGGFVYALHLYYSFEQFVFNSLGHKGSPPKKTLTQFKVRIINLKKSRLCFPAKNVAVSILKRDFAQMMS